MPEGLAALEPMLLGWLMAMLRPGAALLAAPVFGMPQVPVPLRLVIALALGLPGMSMASVALPPDGMVSLSGLLFATGEIACGLAIGFAVQIGFAAAVLGGELISNTMGLGFAAMNDPVGGQMSPAVGQLLSILATFLFFAMNGHLQLARVIVESYRALPPGAAWLSAEAMIGMVRFGGLVFSAGLAVALPVGFALVLVQLIMAMIGRSAPTLNLFAVGMPAALLAGIVLLAIALPVMADAIAAAISDSLDHAAMMARG